VVSSLLRDRHELCAGLVFVRIVAFDSIASIRLGYIGARIIHLGCILAGIALGARPAVVLASDFTVKVLVA
jgi:hypothetical protein